MKRKYLLQTKLCLIIIIAVLSCSKKDSNQQNPTSPPVITSIFPDSAHYGAVITITGTNFSSVPANNIVKISGVIAAVQKASGTSLSVTIPTTSAGSVTVSCAAGSATGPIFKYLPDIFVAGIAVPSVGGYQMATYWRNGIVKQLTSGFTNASAFAIAVQDTDVYVAGNEFRGRFSYARVWKNGLTIDLTDASTVAAANAIAFSGTDMYVAGYENNGTYNVAKVWKNKVPQSLTDGTKDAVANSIALSGNDIYVGGYEIEGTRAIAKIWKNGVAMTLTNGIDNANNYGYVNAIAVAGSDIYATGVERTPNYADYYAEFWKNGVPAILKAQMPSSAHANGLFINGNDVYICGYYRFDAIGIDGDIPVYWKNGEPVQLSFPAIYGSAISIVVAGNDIYVVGDTGVIWKNVSVLTKVSSVNNSVIATSLLIR